MSQTRNGGPSGVARKTLGIFLGGLFLIFIWHCNYNLIGDFYDYSILTSACGQLHEGLKPYRDFSTPLQSLTIYACYAAEKIFGRRYLALAYGNLALGLAFYAVCIRLLRGRMPLFLRLLTSAALCIATFFQHGILWYNSIAMMLLTLTAWCCAILYRSPCLRLRDVAMLCLLLFLSSMCKINFHLFGLGLACTALLLRFLKIGREERWKFIWILPVIFLSGVLLGPFTEIMANGTTLHAFLQNVLVLPASRAKGYVSFLNPNLYLDKVSDFYPDNWSSGVYLKSLLIYVGCAYLTLARPAQSGRKWMEMREINALRLFAPILLAVLLLGAMMLSLTNSETQMLTSSFVVAGLVAVFLMFAPDMSAIQDLGFKFGIFLLSAYFFIAGSASAFMHSRVRYFEHSWSDTVLQTIYKTKKLSALKNAVPFYEASDVSPQLASGYFQGVRFTGLSHTLMDKVVAFVSKNNMDGKPQRIYWGPGLQILNRVYGDLPRGRLPLWYHFQVSVRDKDSPEIIDELKKDNYEWIIANVWIREMPGAVRNYITNNYEQLGDETLNIYHQKR